MMVSDICIERKVTVDQGVVLVTGGAGRIGSMLKKRLTMPLRMVDTVSSAGVLTMSVTDMDAMRSAMRGVSAVIHLASIIDNDDWEQVSRINIDGTRTVLEAARLEGVRQVVLASSNHAVGFHQRDREQLRGDLRPRPDTYYGVSKAAVEALGSLYSDRFGMNVVCLRIGTCSERPPNTRALSTWLSPDDVARLMTASLTAEGFHIVWGVSANTRRWWSLEGGSAIGFDPVDDAETFASEMGEPDLSQLEHQRVGGIFCSAPLGGALP